MSVRSKKARLPLGKWEYVDTVFYSRSHDHLLIAFEGSSGADGDSYGRLCRFEMPALRRTWCSAEEGFNYMAATDAEGNILVGSVGMLGKVRAQDGQYLWRHGNLYAQSPAFNMVGVPTERDGLVSFTVSAAQEGDAKHPRKRLTLNSSTGVIESVEENGGSIPFVRGLERPEGKCKR